MSVFGAAVLVTEATPKPQLPRWVAQGSFPHQPRSDSLNLHVLAAPPRRDRREVSRHRKKRALGVKQVQ